MSGKVLKGLLLVVLAAFYLKNIGDSSSSLWETVLYSRINFVLLVVMLYLASEFVEICKTICVFVLGFGLLFHGYMYYNAYYNAKHNAGNVQEVKCDGAGSSWYSKLNERCY